MNVKPVKVLSVCTSLNGGAGRAAYRIHQGVSNFGVDSRMLLKEGGADDPSVITLDELLPNGLSVKVFDWVRNKFRNKIQHYRWSRYPGRENVYMSDMRGTDIHGALRKLDYDVLHLHWINQRFISLDDLPKDKPIVWTLHDSWPFCGVCHYFLDCEKYKDKCGSCPFLHSGKANDLSNQVWRKKANVYKNLNMHIVTPSSWLGNCAKQSSLLGRFPITVIPNCLDINTFRRLDENEISTRWSSLQQISNKKPLLLYGAVNATKDKIKGFCYLLSALKVLEQQCGVDDIELIVFGASSSDLNIEVNIPIHYVDYVMDTNELVSLYNLASVMIVPSMTEVFGQTASEALACETPVVAFNCTGIKEVVDHKVNGYLARPYDSSDLAEGVLWCLNNNDDNRLGGAGREKVLRNYAMDVVASQYIQEYNRFLF